MLPILMGLGFIFGDQKKSEIKFDSENTDQSIQIFTSNNFSTANLSISEAGNVALNGVPNAEYDFMIQHPDGVDSNIELFTDANVPATIEFHYDSIGDDLINEAGELYGFYFDQNFMAFTDYLGDYLMAFSQEDKYVGFFDTEPHEALTINDDVVLVNQHSVFFKQSDQVTSIAAIQGGDVPSIYSTDDITLKSLYDVIAINISKDGLAINEFKTDLDIDEYEIGFEVNGTVLIDGDIYDQNNDKIFPFLVRNLTNTERQSTVNVINIDTDSGLVLTNSGFDVNVTAPGFYHSILMPNGDVFEASKNMDLRLIGRGITIESNNVEDQGVFNSGTYDRLTLLNDLITGGEISGPLEVNGNFVVLNYISGNGFGLRDVPYRWQKTTANVDVDGVTEVHGDVYYDRGNVGIFVDDPKSSLEILGTMNANEVIVGDTLGISNFIATENINFSSQGAMEFESENGDVIFMRNLIMS